MILIRQRLSRTRGHKCRAIFSANLRQLLLISARSWRPACETLSSAIPRKIPLCQLLTKRTRKCFASAKMSLDAFRCIARGV